MNSEAITGLIKQTFVERLNTEQILKKKEFVELRKIDVGKYCQEKLEKRKRKDEYLAFNYLWRKFPETMATKNQNPQFLRQEMGEMEFERVLKVAKRFYGFWAYASCAMMAISFIGLGLEPHFGELFAVISGSICLLDCPFLVLTWFPYFSPDDHLSVDKEARREYLISLYQNQNVQKKEKNG